MIASFKDIASAMNRCVAIIEDYTKLSPSSISAPDKKSASGPALPTGEVKKERKARVPKPKDPKAPKRPPSAYLLFQNEVREDERKAHPDLSYKEVLGVISQKWKDLSEEQRKVRLRKEAPAELTEFDRCSRLHIRMRRLHSA